MAEDPQELSQRMFRLEARVTDAVIGYVGNNLHHDRSWQGLRWSPNMPDDDPDSEMVVVDGDGREFVLDVHVQLTPIEFTTKGRGAPTNPQPPSEPPT